MVMAERTGRMLISAAGLLGLLAGPAAAHHGWSGYDASQVLTLTGVIRESGYEHPHGHVRLEVPGKTWLVILAPPSRMERRGLAAAALQVGATVSVVGYPHRTNQEEMRAERITVNGQTVELR
jgi:Family of unknown function (DUF6152)